MNFVLKVLNSLLLPSAKLTSKDKNIVKELIKKNQGTKPDLSSLDIPSSISKKITNSNALTNSQKRNLIKQQNNKKISVVKKDKTSNEIVIQQNKSQIDKLKDLKNVTSSSNNAAKLNKNFAKLRERSRNAEKLARIKEAEKLAKLKAAEKLKDKKLQITNQSKDKKTTFDEVYKNQQNKNINKVDPKVDPKVNPTFISKDNRNALADKIITDTKVNNTKVNNPKVNNNNTGTNPTGNKYLNYIKRNPKTVGLGIAALTVGGAKLVGDGTKDNKNIIKNTENKINLKVTKPNTSNVKIESLPKLKSNDYTGRFIDKKGDVAYDSASDFLAHMFGTPKKRAMPEKSARIVGTGNTLKRKVADTKGAGKGVMFTTKRTGGMLSSSSKVVAKQVKGWGKARKPRG